MIKAQAMSSCPNLAVSFHSKAIHEAAQEEEDRDLTAFEKEIEKVEASLAPNHNAQLSMGAIPQHNGVLSKHAAEFWFPECRNCACCSGFRHGCKCCTGSINTCVDPSCVDVAFRTQVDSQLASRPSAAASAAVSAPSASEKLRLAVPHASAAASDVCRFESSPGGCRFGAACRFKHGASPMSGHPATSPGAPGSPAPCVYFQRGFCQFGNSCRFGHF
jgi:hypothetical protein